MTRRMLLQSLNCQILVPGSRPEYAYVGSDEPATRVMTDFRAGPMITTGRSTSIEVALQQMKMSGARFLFVVGDDEAVVGDITAYDIQGEKPMRHMQSIGCSHTTCAWRDVLVENIMQPVAEWQVLEYSTVTRLTVGEVADLITGTGRRYLVVVERRKSEDSWHVRGLFSAARIQMLLRTSPPLVARAGTFAEIEQEMV